MRIVIVTSFFAFITALYCRYAAAEEQERPIPIVAYLATVKAADESIELQGIVQESGKKDEAVLLLYADTASAARIKQGQAVVASLPSPRVGELRGKVRAVLDADEESANKHRVVAVVENVASSLTPGMAVKTRVSVLRSPRNPFVPKNCLIYDGGSAFLFVVEHHGTEADSPAFVQRRLVITGVVSGDMVEIKDGLRPAQLVAMPPLNKFTSGAAVTVTKVITETEKQKAR